MSQLHAAERARLVPSAELGASIAHLATARDWAREEGDDALACDLERVIEALLRRR